MTTDLVVTITDELIEELDSAGGRALPEMSASIIRALIAQREELKDEIQWLEDKNQELSVKNGAYNGMASALMRSDKLLTEARREIAELKRDAERYRWLRDNRVYEDSIEGEWTVGIDFDFEFPRNANHEDALDIAIDIAMKGDQQ